MHAVQSEPSLGELFGALSQQLSNLVRQEVRLAKAEMSQNVSGVGRDVGLLAAGGLVAYAGFMAIVAAVIYLLALALPLWLSALVVGLVVVGAGYALVRRGLAGLQRRDLAPRATIRSLREDVEWAKGEAA